MSSRKQSKQIAVATLLSIFCCYHGVHSFVSTAAQPPPFSRLRISPQPRQLSPRQARLHDIYIARSRLHVKTSYGKLCVIGSSSSSSQQDSFSGEAKGLFRQACDEQDLMTLDTFKGMAFVTELLADGDLLENEVEGLWKDVAKSPKGAGVELIDEDSFVLLYNSIDNLFEDDADDEARLKEFANKKEQKIGDSDILSSIFNSLATSNGVLSRQALLEWDEVQNLITDGLLGQDEFDCLWETLPKASDGDNEDSLNFQGFLALNEGLDDLFEFEDDAEDTNTKKNVSVRDMTPVIYDDSLSPEALFSALEAADGYIGKDELKRWGGLQEMLSAGELLPREVEKFLEEVTRDSNEPPNKLNKDQFSALYNKIEALFEETEDGDGYNNVEEKTRKSQVDVHKSQQKTVSANTNVSKKELLAVIAKINQDKDRLPCGLEATEKEQAIVQEFVSALESNSDNIVRQKQGAIEMTDVAGEWNLLYSSSAAMAYNKGLSGLGGSVPNGSFGGLKMKLTATKFMTDLEYVERINVVPDSASFDVTIDGDWELRSSVSIFTGDPSIVLTVVPEKVTYGPTSTRADHWKSLGPTNMMDVTYLDRDIRIMRGNTSTNSILVFRRTN